MKNLLTNDILLLLTREGNVIGGFFMERKMKVVEDLEGRKIVFIHDIIFKKKQYVEWKEVKEYLKRYVGDVYKILSTD